MTKLLLPLLFLGVTATAKILSMPQEPNVVAGSYLLNEGGIGLVSAKHQVSIFVANQQATNYVNQLRSQNYACQNIDGRHVKCERFLKDLNTIETSFENVYALYRNQKLEISESASSAELINDADFLTEWKKTQNAEWFGYKFTEVFFTVLKKQTPEDLVKFKLTNERNENAYFYLAPHVGGVNVAFQHLERIKLQPKFNFVVEESLGCLLEVNLVRQ